MLASRRPWSVWDRECDQQRCVAVGGTWGGQEAPSASARKGREQRAHAPCGVRGVLCVELGIGEGVIGGGWCLSEEHEQKKKEWERTNTNPFPTQGTCDSGDSPSPMEQEQLQDDIEK